MQSPSVDSVETTPTRREVCSLVVGSLWIVPSPTLFRLLSPLVSIPFRSPNSLRRRFTGVDRALGVVGRVSWRTPVLQLPEDQKESVFGPPIWTEFGLGFLFYRSINEKFFFFLL